MKNIYTENFFKELSTPPTGDDKKQLVIPANSCFVEDQNASTNSADGQILFEGCNCSTTNTIFNNNKNDANRNGASFSFLPIASLFKLSFMKQVLRYLQIIVNFFTDALKTFFEGIFTNSIFNKRIKPGELQLVPVKIRNTNILPFNKNAMRKFLLINQTKMNLHIKTILQKAGKSRFTLAIASLFLISTLSAQNVNITIQASGTTSGTFTGGTFTPSVNTNAIINVTDLVTQLNANNNVTINTAKAGGTDVGNVIFSTAVTAPRTSTTQITFSVTAAGSITVNSSSAINLTPSGSGGSNNTTRPGTNISFSVGASISIASAVTTTGNFRGTFQAGGNGGNVTLSGGTNVSITSAITSNGGASGFFATAGNAGNISITGATGITLTANLSAAGGTNGGNGTNGNDGTYTISDGASVVTTGGGLNDGQTAGVISDGGNNGSTLTKTGTGTFNLGGANTYIGATTISGGVLLLNNANAIPGGIGNTGGTANIVINGGVIGLGNGNFSRGLGTGATQIQFTATGGFAAYGGPRTVNLGNAGATVTWAIGSFVPNGSILILSASSANNTVTFVNPIALGNNSTRTIYTNEGSASVDAIISGVISGAGTSGIIKSGLGTLILSAINTYTGSTTINPGSLILNPSANLNQGTAVILAGGALSTTGITTNRTITLSTLNLSSSSTIGLNNNVHTLTFANSSGVSWAAGQPLIINGWTGTPGAGSPGANGKIMVGVGGLTPTQLGQITFTGFATGAMILSTGELVPALQNPILAIAGNLNDGSSCINTAASPQTYTINNTGAAASGISVVSNNTQFVVSNVSSTTIPANGSATFQVTFTPNASGAQSALITVSSTTSGSNSPTATLTGTGIANNITNPPSSNPTLCINTLLTNITISTTGATGISNDGVSGANGLPTGTSAHWSGNTITISGTPTVSGIFNYNIPLTGGCGSVNATGTITVNTAPGITTPPSNQTVTYGASSVSFSATASGTPAPTYQWQVNTGAGFTNIGGQISSTLSIANPTVAMNGNKYQVVVTNTCASATSSAATLTVNPAPLTITANNQVKTYGSVFTFAGTEFSSSGLLNSETIGSVNLTSPGTPATAGVIGTPYAITPSAATGGTFNSNNYSISYNSGNLTVNPATLTISANNQSKTYGSVFTFTGSEFTSSGLKNSETIGSVSLSSPGTSATAAVSGSPYAITPSAATGGTFNSNNYNISYNSGNLTINPATLSITANNQSKTYGSVFTFVGTEFSSSGLLNSETIGSVNLTSPGTPATAAVSGSPYAITPSAASGGTFNSNNYSISYNSGNLTINPATLTISANNQAKTYGSVFTFAGTEFSSSGLLNSETIGSVNLTSPGTPATAGVLGSPYAITPSAATGGTFNSNNYNISYNSGNLTINPVTLTISANNQSKTYGSVFTFAGTEFSSSGLLNSETIGSVNLTSPGTPATAGVLGSPYTITVSAAAGGTFDANNYNIGYTTGMLTVNKANATINVTPYTVTYDGAAHTATITTASGVISEDFTADVILNTTHTNAGTYNADSWSFAGNSNYNADGATITDEIDPASSSITVTGSNTFTYNGIPQGPATNTETGSAGAITYSYSGAVSTSYGPSAAKPTDAGNYIVTATVAADANYNTATSAAYPFSISKADAVISVAPYGVTYDGDAHTSAFTAVGVESTPANLASLMNVNATTHTNAGNYTGDAWSFAGNNNYNAISGTVDNVIGKANAVISVSPYSVTYDGDAHTSVFTAVGIESTPDDLIALMNVGATTHTNAGIYNGDAWSFTGNINYNSTNGTVDNAIGKADAVISVTPYALTYDGVSHTSVFTAVGIENPNPVDLTSLMNVSATAHTDAGTYSGDAWSFAGNNNYNLTSGTVNNSIGKADAVISVTPYNVTYDALSHTSAFTATGIESPNPVDLTALMNVSATTHTNAGTYTGDAWTFAGNTDYNATNGTVDNAIGQVSVTVTADTKTKVYGSLDPSLTYQITSGALAGSDAFMGSLTRDIGESAGTYPITQGTLALSSDYNLGYIGANLTITNIPITASANAGTVECAGGTTTLTVTASGGDGLLQYSLNGGSYQSSNIFTVNAAGSPYVVTVEDADGFTVNSNSVTVTEKPSPTINLTSGAESGGQTICIGNSINDITYAIGGNTTGATVTALPSGLTGSYDPGTQTFTITGMPANPGLYSYTVTTTGTCTNVSLSGTILVNDNATISLSSASADQTVCVNTSLDHIVYNIGGGATSADVAGLPAGITGNYDPGTGLLTISGSPTVSGTFAYIVNTYGHCDIPTASGTITVNANSSIVLSSLTGTDAQTVCSNSPITDIVYTIDDGATGANVTGLPDGVTGSYDATSHLFTITGTPTQSPVQYGTSNYTVATEGPCVKPTLTGTITINPVATVDAISNQVICDGISSAAVNFASPTPLGDGAITYTWSNDNTSIGLAAGGTGGIGVFTATNPGTIPISGNITVTPHYTNNSVTCDGIPSTFTITVNANSTISLSSSNESAAQTVCINSAINDITYSIGGGATGANVTGLPDGVTGSYNAGVFTITGTPTESGTFSYEVKTEGPCVNISLSGTINVTPDATISLSSGAGTNNQTVCINTGISGISYATGGSATNASITSGSLPDGVTGSYNGGVFTITGTPSEPGIFSYTITATGVCVDATVSGTITVNPTPVVNAVSNATSCNNSTIAAINFSTPTAGGTVSYTWSSTADVGFGTTGNGNISSFTAKNRTNSPITATITVTPSYTNNMVTCGGNSTSFTITVNPTPVANSVSNKTYCNNTQGEAVSFSSPTTGGTTSYSWTSSINIGFGTTGSGDINSYTAVNNSINPVTATVTVTPSLNGCTGSPITFTIMVNPSANAGTISGSSTMCLNTTTQLSENGSIGGTWTSSNPGVASINAATGLVTSASEGSTTIYYTVSNICGASSSSFTINVNSTANAGTISGPGTVCSGSSVVLTSNGNSGGLWFSANPSVATVNSAGVVTGVNGGTTAIYYYVSTPTCGSAHTSANITVTSGGDPGIILGSSTMCAGSATVLITTGNSGGTWASTNMSVATIDPSGFVIGQGAGNTTISYTLPSNSCSSGPLVAYLSLNVSPAGNAGAITGNSNICVSSTTLLSSNGSTGGTWYSGNNLVATVDPNSGFVTGVAPGNILITYHVSNSCGNGSATFPVSVTVGANAGTLSGPSSVCAGSTINLTSNGNPGGAWTSSNTGAAIVDANGVVKGISAGTTIITYAVTSNCSSSAISTTITVNPVPIAGTLSGAATVCAGLSTPFTSDGTSGGTWSSSNPAAASVNSASGVVTGVAAGSAIITYTVTTNCGTVNSSSPTITVNPVLNAGTISGGSSVCIGSDINLTSNGSTGGVWSSSNTAIATIDAATGVVSAVATGNATIKYTVSNTCGTFTVNQLITVNPLVNAGVVTGSGNVCAGLSTAYTSNGNTGGTWSSSNSAVATVNSASGQVTGVKAGSSIITYTVTTGCGTASASANITVNPLPEDGVITGPNAVCVGHPITLSSNISGGTWGSNSPSFATINSNGQVSGVTAGNATITYTVSTTCGSNVETYIVTVNSAPYAGIVSGESSICVGSASFYTEMGGAPGGIWRSTKPAIASVDPVTGEVTAISAGNTVIVYSVTNSCGSSNAAQTVFVNSLPNAGTISGPSSVCAQSTINLSASGDAGGVWTSNNTLVATVNPSTGVVTGVAPGTASIIYTVGSATVCGTSAASQLVTVNPLANAGTISGTTTFCTGLSSTLASDGTVGGTWSSSNPTVALVDAASGVVTGVSAGTASINYTVTNVCGSKTATTTVSINPLPDAGTISGPSSVCAGSTINLSSNVSGGTWSSSTHSVATIGLNTGIVTGVAPGNTTVTYTVTTSCGTSSKTYAISVNPLPNAGTLSGATYLCTGGSSTISSNITGGTWSSSNPSTATVNSTTGLVTGIAAGSTSITYNVSSVCGTATQSVVVTIGDILNAGTVSGAATLCTGSTAIFTSNGTGGGTWSSNNSAAATVNSTTGVITGVAAGSASITYTVSSTCGSSASSANITISAIPNAGSINGSSTLCAGSITTFTSNGASGGTWSSNNNLVATVNSATGVVTGVGTGNATITYTVVNTCGATSASSDVNVNALPNSGIVSGSGTLCVGSTTAFTSNGNGGGSWSSNNTSAATVNSITGAVTGVAAGSATISYTVSAGTCGSAVSSANITINPLPNPGTLTGSASICAGSTTTYTIDGTINGSWSSDNTAVATVDASTGVVTGVAAGSTIITYTVTNGCGTAGATQLITVNPLPNSGTITGSATVCAGSTTAYTSDGLSGTWTSDNMSVATVDPASGLVTGMSPGNANIIYSVTTPCGTTTSSAAITVIILPNAGNVTGSSTVCAGSATTYTSDGLRGGTWSSATPSVASVNVSTGEVTGVAPGNATITYTFTNECGTNTASQMITVNPLPNAGTVSGAATVCIGATATYTSDGLGGGTWSSSEPSIASVDPTSGVVTGMTSGNATIIYTSNTPCGITTASSGITVVVTPNAGIVSGNTTVCVGANTFYTSDGLSGGTWSSDSPDRATVDPNTGKVTGVAAGNATIRYTFTNSCGTVSASQMIVVNPLPNAGTLTGAATVCVGSIAIYSSDGLTGGTWSSDNTTVATVSSSGVVTGVAAGSATITYTSTTPCGAQTTTASITVNPVLVAGAVSGSATLCIGSNTPYTSDGSSGGTWSSVTPSVASVDANTGVVTGMSTGNATIKYTVSSSCGTSTSSRMIAVSLAAIPGTITGVSSICDGSYTNFSLSGGQSGGTWSSSNTTVANVNSSGRVTGVGNGTAVISYIVTSGCGTNSATKNITVSEAPSIIANNITVNTDLNECSAIVALGSNVTVTGSPSSLQFRIGYFFFSWPISATHTFYRGTTPVTVIASNSCGTIERIFLVTVVDNQPPTIVCKPNATRETNGHSSKYSVRGHEFDATATDGCGVASLIYSLSGATTTGFNANNTSLNNVKLNIGTTIITWKATDVNGNVSTCSSTVTVSGDDDDNHHGYYGRMNSNNAVLTVKAAPNPTSYYFTLQINSESTEMVKLTVVDELGRTVELMKGIDPNSTIQIGSRYHPGIYIVHAVQGNDAVSLKLIKEGKLY